MKTIDSKWSLKQIIIIKLIENFFLDKKIMILFNKYDKWNRDICIKTQN